MNREDNIKAVLETNFTGFREDIIDCAAKVLMDVTEVRHAYWKKVGMSLYECSNCQKVAPYYTEGTHIVYWPELNYCPNCGAKMDGDEE